MYTFFELKKVSQFTQEFGFQKTILAGLFSPDQFVLYDTVINGR